MKFIINLFGTGVRFWECQIDQDMYDDMNRIREKHNVDWEKILFDLHFLNHYGYNHWSELSSTQSKTGFLLTAHNIIEVKQKGKLITRLKSNELDNSQVLFPLYRTKENSKSESNLNNDVQLKLIQFEKGLIAKFAFQTDMFSIDTLEFNLENMDTMNFLESISFNSSKLDILLEDTVIVGTKVIL